MVTKNASPKSSDPTIAEEEWGGMKLSILGLITLLVSLAVLYTISPYQGIVLRSLVVAVPARPRRRSLADPLASTELAQARTRSNGRSHRFKILLRPRSAAGELSHSRRWRRSRRTKCDAAPRAVTIEFVDTIDIGSRALAERLLALMDRKHHWAYASLTRPGLSREQHFQHFRHEYLVYVRDFPVLLARALGQVPDLPDVRAALAENLYEEQTGGISRSAPHPELFLRMMEGLGFARDRFGDDDAWLHPAARAYRDFLRDTSARQPWHVAVALLTIFVEERERAGRARRHVRPLARRGGDRAPPAGPSLRLPQERDAADARARDGRGRASG